MHPRLGPCVSVDGLVRSSVFLPGHHQRRAGAAACRLLALAARAVHRRVRPHTSALIPDFRQSQGPKRENSLPLLRHALAPWPGGPVPTFSRESSGSHELNKKENLPKRSPGPTTTTRSSPQFSPRAPLASLNSWQPFRLVRRRRNERKKEPPFSFLFNTFLLPSRRFRPLRFRHSSPPHSCSSSPWPCRGGPRRSFSKPSARPPAEALRFVSAASPPAASFSPLFPRRFGGCSRACSAVIL
jgi:hypothetical protein